MSGSSGLGERYISSSLARADGLGVHREVEELDIEISESFLSSFRSWRWERRWGLVERQWMKLSRSRNRTLFLGERMSRIQMQGSEL